LIQVFEQERVLYHAKFRDDEPDRLEGIVFTSPESKEPWKRFHDCLSLDNTCKTNILGFPLLVVTTQTNINTTATIVFGLVDNERRDGFSFLAEGVDLLRRKLDIEKPAVIVTDKDDSMRESFREVFPDTQLQLCCFRIVENVLEEGTLAE